MRQFSLRDGVKRQNYKQNPIMNSKVRRYEPFFLSPQQSRAVTVSPPQPAPYWRDKVNREVTLCYNRIKNSKPSESKISLPENNQLQEVKSVQSIGEQGAKSCSTLEYTQTPVKKKLEIYSQQAVSTLYKSEREKEIQNYYSQRVELLEEECAYLRKEFIGHCLKHHKKEFQGQP